MLGDTAVVRFDPDASRLDALELRGAARIRGTTEAPGRLREMSARTIRVAYDDDVIDSATLSGAARVELFGLPGLDRHSHCRWNGLGGAG